MKKIDEMTHEELISVTNKQIDQLVKLEAAEQGIKILPKPSPVEVFLDTPKKHAEAWTCKATNYWFLDLDVLRKFICFMRENSDHVARQKDQWDAKSEFLVRGVREGEYQNDLEINHSVFYWDEQYHSTVKSIEEKKRLEKEHSDLMEEYENSWKNLNSIRDQIEGIVQEALELESRCLSYIARLDEYLEIAEGNKEQAWKFFVKAYGDEIDLDPLSYVSQRLQDHLEFPGSE